MRTIPVGWQLTAPYGPSRAAALRLGHAGASLSGHLTRPSHPVHGRTVNDKTMANKHQGHRAAPVCIGHHSQCDLEHPTLLQHAV